MSAPEVGVKQYMRKSVRRQRHRKDTGCQRRRSV